MRIHGVQLQGLRIPSSGTLTSDSATAKRGGQTESTPASTPTPAPRPSLSDPDPDPDPDPDAHSSSELHSGPDSNPHSDPDPPVLCDPQRVSSDSDSVSVSLRMDVGGGYQVLELGAVAGPVARLLGASLAPANELEAALRALAISPQGAARFALALQLGSDAFQVVLDLRQGEVGLMRWAAGERVAQRVAKGPRAVDHELVKRGVPRREHLLELHCFGFGPIASSVFASAPSFERLGDADSGATAPLRRSPGPSLEQAPQPEPTPADAALSGEEAPDLERLKLLRDARGRLRQVERELARLVESFEAHAELARIEPEFDALYAQARVAARARDQELGELEADRRALVQQRARLRGGPRHQRVGLMLGAATGIGGLMAAQLLDPVLHAISLTGAGLMLGFGLLGRATRSRAARIETRLSGLRIRERGTQQRFERAAGRLLEFQSTLELSSIEALREAVVSYRAERAQLARHRAELSEAQLGFGAKAERELAELEQACADYFARLPGGTASGVPQAGEFPSDAAGSDARSECAGSHSSGSEGSGSEGSGSEGGGSESAGSESAESEGAESNGAESAALGGGESPSPSRPSAGECRFDPERLIAIAHEESGLPMMEVRLRMAPMLPLYLRALTEGRVVDARRGGERSWEVRWSADETWQPLTRMRQPDAEQIQLAFRLALLEGLAQYLRTPLLIGPQLRGWNGDAQLALGRALERLGRVTQVIHLTSEHGAWERHAQQLQRLSAENAAR